MPFLSKLSPYRVSIPAVPEDAKEVVLSFHAAGINLGTNVGIELKAANGDVLYRIWPNRATARLRTATYRDLVFSLVRATRIGIRCENEYRRRRTPEGALPCYFYEIPAEMVRAQGPLTLEMVRLCRFPAFVSSASIQFTKVSPTGRGSHDAAIDGYVQETSVVAGDQLSLRLHSKVGPVKCTLMHYLQEPVPLLTVDNVAVSEQTVPNSGYRISPEWPEAVQIRVPADKPGLLGIRVSATGEDSEDLCIPVIARKHPEAPQSEVLVVVSTNTWAAYNEWGGASLYHWRTSDALGRSSARRVTRTRPNPFANPEKGEGHLARGLQSLVAWLEKRDFSFDLVGDEDVEQDPSPFEGYMAVVLDNHAEYWSQGSIEKLKRYLSGGGSLISLSGNPLYWRTECIDDLVEVVKPSGVHGDGETGGLFADYYASESTILGVAYTPRGANTYAPYKIEKPDHWVFEGTGGRAGQEFGIDGVFGGASGHETDKVNRHSPRNTVRVARGTNPAGSGADMVVIERPGGGLVFSVGSITFVGALETDPVCSRILINVFQKVGVTVKQHRLGSGGGGGIQASLGRGSED